MVINKSHKNIELRHLRSESKVMTFDIHNNKYEYYNYQYTLNISLA